MARSTGELRSGSFRLRYRPDRGTVRLLWLVALLLSFALVAALLTSPRVLRRVELLGYDLLLGGLDDRQRSDRVVVVDVDEASLHELGQWPWPRYRVARLLDRIREAGASAVAVDFLFAEADRMSLALIEADLLREREVSIDLDHLEESLLDNDRVLAEAMRPPVVVSGILFDFQPPAESGSIPIRGPGVSFHRTADAPDDVPIPEATRATFPVHPLAAAAGTLGFLNSLPDIDGTTRRAPLMIRYANTFVPSLALAAVLRAVGVDRVDGEVSAGGVERFRLGDRIVPTDHQGSLLLPFDRRTTGRFDAFSAVDVIEGRASLEALQGRIVFVGSSAAGLRDIHSTPFDRVLPGVLVHAVVAETLLEGKYLRKPTWSLGFQVLGLFLAGVLVAALICNFRVYVCAAVVLAATAGVWFAAQALLSGPGLYLSPVFLILALVVDSVMLGAVRFRSEELRARAAVRELAVAQNCAMLGLVSITETRDPETGQHVVRTQHYVGALAEHLSGHPAFRDELTPENLDAIYRSAPLHDIGKVGVPDRILLKPGKLSDEEFEVMKRHTETGYQVLRQAEEMSGLDRGSSFLRYAGQIALAHHEKWDGSGYPHGLSGAEIPIAARIMSVADAYDALRSERHYKPAYPHELAAEVIEKSSGIHFDPDVVQAFLGLEEEFVRISEEYGDEPAEAADGTQSRGMAPAQVEIPARR